MTAVKIILHYKHSDISKTALCGLENNHPVFDLKSLLSPFPEEGEDYKLCQACREHPEYAMALLRAAGKEQYIIDPDYLEELEYINNLSVQYPEARVVTHVRRTKIRVDTTSESGEYEYE